MRGVSPGNWDTLSRKTHNTNTFFAQCFGNTKTRAAYLHTLILLSPHLPQVHSQRHHALSPDLPHKHHIYSCHTYHTQWHTEPHMLIYFGSACHEETNTKSENKTKKTKQKFHKVRSNASLEALPCSLHPLLLICTVQFFDLWNCCGSELHPPKKSKTSCATHMVPGNRFCHCIFPKTRH